MQKSSHILEKALKGSVLPVNLASGVYTEVHPPPPR
jgi:hypothetical protein